MNYIKLILKGLVYLPTNLSLTTYNIINYKDLYKMYTFASYQTNISINYIETKWEKAKRYTATITVITTTMRTVQTGCADAAYQPESVAN